MSQSILSIDFGRLARRVSRVLHAITVRHLGTLDLARPFAPPPATTVPRESGRERGVQCVVHVSRHDKSLTHMLSHQRLIPWVITEHKKVYWISLSKLTQKLFPKVAVISESYKAQAQSPILHDYQKVTVVDHNSHTRVPFSALLTTSQHKYPLSPSQKTPPRSLFRPDPV
ncbi:hypothetical protein BD324DRAFT_167532 [Kockovaella imperatae]|uniref:Uncharacterized protein n=1 Tax=Kockovaella imperatae TaxID=4999 RepID=A0A1Y1U7Z6_9TREE|nr:hypothetical protein BD324DRAFT_167532 [Kockovaella imperatae]ORX34160.1 hypothetical protein BD324DRAFT_167532 [Kockovaella imperatae]